MFKLMLKKRIYSFWVDVFLKWYICMDTLLRGRERAYPPKGSQSWKRVRRSEYDIVR